MNVFIEKFTAETPKGWLKTRNIAATIAAIATAALPFLDLFPEKIALIIKLIIAISGIIAGKAQLQTTDKDLSKKRIINLNFKKNGRNRKI